MQDVFDEQLDVRGMLRSSSQTDTNLQWTIISTGMFTSFLFEPSFGVVDLENASICALGSWENRVTLTTPADIGRITAEIVLGLNSSSSAGTTISSDPSSSPSPDSGKVLFIGGDTISYAELASLVERESSRNHFTGASSMWEMRRTLSAGTRGMRYSSIRLFLSRDKGFRGIWRGHGIGSGGYVR